MPKKKTTKPPSTPKKKTAKPAKSLPAKRKSSPANPQKTAKKAKAPTGTATRERTLAASPEICDLVLRTLKESGRAVTSVEISTILVIDESIILAALGSLITRGFVARATPSTYRYVSDH